MTEPVLEVSVSVVATAVPVTVIPVEVVASLVSPARLSSKSPPAASILPPLALSSLNVISVSYTHLTLPTKA